MTLLLLHHFGVNLDLDRIAHHRFAGLEKIVVDQIEILAINGGRRGNSAARITPRVDHFRRRSIHVKRDFTRGPVDGEITDHLQLPSATYDQLGLEIDSRIFFNVEEIWALEVLVPRFDPGVDGSDVDTGRYLRLG